MLKSNTSLLNNLAKYYRDLLFALSTQAGKHFIDVNTVLHYGLTADLSLFIPDIEELINTEIISFPIEKSPTSIITEIIERNDEFEDREEKGNMFEETDGLPEEQVKKEASATLIAIYRKQEFDPFNREVIIGFPIITGKIEKKKFCAPLFYYKAKIEFEPLKNMITLIKDFEIPTLNFQLIKHLVELDEDVEVLRKKILPCLYRDDFGLSTIKEVIIRLSELVPAFKGINLPSKVLSLSEAIKLREYSGAKVVNTSIIVNAKRTNAYLLDDLSQLTQIEKTDVRTVIDIIISPPKDYEGVEDFDKSFNKKDQLPLFPLLSNKSQRDAATKAEKANLIVIQGPPGTGKSQTIVNLICHLVAKGRSVLVTSHQNKALEIIIKNMPNIEYLAMSMLKNEKESINELRNKIESYHAYVSNIDVNHYKELLKKRMEELERIDDDIKKLQIRFSELKIIERERYPVCQKYHNIRDFDIIDESDLIPEGSVASIATALSEYSQLLQKIKTNYREIENFISCDNSDSIKDLIINLKQLIEIYDWINNNIFVSEKIFHFCRLILRASFDNTKTIDYLNHVIQWLDKYGSNLLLAIKSLSESHNLEIDFYRAKKQAVIFGAGIDRIIKCKDTLLAYQKNINNIKIESKYPDCPDSTFLKEVAMHIESLSTSSNSWWKWNIFPIARKARRFFLSHKFPGITYKKRKESIEKLKSWHDYWRARYSILENLKFLNEIGIPIANLSPNPYWAELELHRNIDLAQKYIDIIIFINELFSEKLSMVEDLLEQNIANVSSLKDLEILKESLEKVKDYLRFYSLLKLKSNQISSFCNSSFSTIEKTIYELRPDKKADEIVNKIKDLSPYFDDYLRIKNLEQSFLRTVSATCTKIKNKIINNEKIPALGKPELVIEAFRLSSFIRRDVLNNPDDIQEVTEKISKLKEKSRSLIVKILNTRRKLALKQGETDHITRFMINNLKQLLKRKRKTYSFVQLREQIEYKKLLEVFPCWIMNIEDVARVFPLEAGLFDYIIVDEASQCNQATVLPLAYRAKKMIVVGDSKQMKNPNTQFLSDTVARLNLTKHGLDRHPKVEFFHGRNSLLDLAIGSQDTSPVFLNEHFRCEPPIIEFSNRYFYNNQLKILTPFRKKRFNPCMEIKLIQGAYDDPDNTKRNEIEAKAVITELKRMIDNGELEGDVKGQKLSVGILSFFRHQATLLQSLMYDAFESNPSIIKEHQIIVSTVDGFQGDERDVILYSFRYAPNSKPGTIHAIQRDDEHSLGRLNVAFTRARRKVVCFISLPKEHFPKGLIRDYLHHVTLAQSFSYNRLGNPYEKEKCQSDFERDVFDDLVKRELEVYAQVPCAGFFIDFVVVDNEGRRIAIECDGDFHYEEGELKPDDYQRQDIIERHGWFIHRISSRHYYSNPQRAIEKLIEDLKKQDRDKEIPSGNYLKTYAKPSQINIQEMVEDTSLLPTTTTEEKIIELLSANGPMPLWKIAHEVGKPKDEVILIMEKLLELEWVINYVDNGVKLWKAID